jgi:CRISPR-associated protein Csd1
MRVPPKKKDSPEVLRFRAAIIKAVLRRTYDKEVPVSLDESNDDHAYLLGRLFATIERLQWVASGGRDPNATIRDRFYGSASTTPAVVFGRLISLSMHHASKARDDGRARFAERVKGAIMARLPAERFPRTLRLEDQGLFAVGYYHQREAFFSKRNGGGFNTSSASADNQQGDGR